MFDDAGEDVLGLGETVASVEQALDRHAVAGPLGLPGDKSPAPKCGAQWTREALCARGASLSRTKLFELSTSQTNRGSGRTGPERNAAEYFRDSRKRS